jgi:hypothetical protein
LSIRPLLWIGTRSYGLYLFHWPIYQIIRKQTGINMSWSQFFLAMAITVPRTGAIRIARADNAMVYPIPLTMIGQ